MSILNLRTAALAVIVVALSAMTPALSATKRVARPSGPPPFCVDRGGPDGPGSSPQDCRYYDYQSCIQAAAVRGNCVRNVDAK